MGERSLLAIVAEEDCRKNDSERADGAKISRGIPVFDTSLRDSSRLCYCTTAHTQALESTEASLQRQSVEWVAGHVTYAHGTVMLYRTRASKKAASSLTRRLLHLAPEMRPEATVITLAEEEVSSIIETGYKSKCSREATRASAMRRWSISSAYVTIPPLTTRWPCEACEREEERKEEMERQA